MTITEYNIIYNKSIEDLIKEIDALLPEGWQPFGNLATDSDDYFYQPLVKYSE